MSNAGKWKEVAIISFPLILAQLSEILFSLVDTWMVGALGTAQLASVGISGTAVCFVQALIMGISSAVQSQASRRIGEGNPLMAGKAMNAGIYVAITLGIPVMILSMWASRPIMGILLSDEKLIQYGTQFFEIRMLGIIGYAINIAFRGYWSSLRLDKYFMIIILITHLLNIVLNYVLIYGNFGFPALGVAGSAIATNIALYIGVLLNIALALVHRKEYGFNLRIPKMESYKSLLRLAIPGGLQQMFFWLGFVVLLWIVGKIGEGDLAVAHVLIQFNFVSILIGIAIGVASGGIVGRALGEQKKEEAYQWGITSARYAFLIIGSIGIFIALCSRLIVGLYFEEALVELAFWPFLISGSIMWTESIIFVFMYSLFGAGDMKRPVMVTVLMQWVFFLPLAYLVGYHFHFGIVGIWTLFAVYRLSIAGLLYLQWRARKWQTIEV